MKIPARRSGMCRPPTAPSPYAITSAPRIAGGKVVIGNAGAEYGVRGYISAFDAETGKLAWRFYTVPGDPSKGFESKAMEAAAKTWSGRMVENGRRRHRLGRDRLRSRARPALFRHRQSHRLVSQRCAAAKATASIPPSILAVRASTGELAWHFQTTPGDNWDFDSTQPLVQADLTIGGRTRKVIMQANKNGFFYVLDRATGEFISGKPFVSGITWASGLDPKTGRPIELTSILTAKARDRLARPRRRPQLESHGLQSGHGAGLSAGERPAHSALHVPDDEMEIQSRQEQSGRRAVYEGPLKAKIKAMPPPAGELAGLESGDSRARPGTRNIPWRWAAAFSPPAGNLVFQGRADGMLAAYRATDGKQVWSFDAGTGIMAPPVTYQVDGVQYVSVLAGWGGPDGLGNDPNWGPVKPGYGRILTFTLGSNATFKAPAYGHKEPAARAHHHRRYLAAGRASGQTSVR